jgi:hypothetical protein
MTKAEMIAYMEARIDVTGRRLTTGARHRQVEQAIIDELYLRGAVKTAKLFIPSAEVLTLNSVPKAFGLIVPSSVFIQPIGVFAAIKFNGSAYATNTIFGIRAVGSSNAIALFHPSFMTATEDKVYSVPLSSPTNTNMVIGADMEAFVQTGNPASGTGDVTAYITYAEIEA